MKFLSRIWGALIIAGVFGYLALAMYYYDQPGGRRYRLVALVVAFMTGLLGKTAAALITAATGLAASIWMLLRKEDDEDKDKIIPTQRL